MLAGVIFDLDGVLIDSEECWSEARRAVVAERDGRWTAGATRAMMGMSAPERSRYLRDELGVDLDPDAINQAVVRRMTAAYRARRPLLPGTVEAVGARWALGLASSSNRELIALALEQAGLVKAFSAVVSAEEVAHGKPAPDVYLEAVARLARTERVRRHRGLERRPALRRRRRHGGGRGAQRSLSAGARRARAGQRERKGRRGPDARGDRARGHRRSRGREPPVGSFRPNGAPAREAPMVRPRDRLTLWAYELER